MQVDMPRAANFDFLQASSLPPATRAEPCYTHVQALRVLMLILMQLRELVREHQASATAKQPSN
eukprot:5070939-Amphidinium_carterae.1